MKKRFPLQVKALLKMLGLLALFGGGGFLIHSEIAVGEELSRKLNSQRQDAYERIEESERVRNFFKNELQKLEGIEKGIQRSLPEDREEFKAFCLTEATEQKITLQERNFDSQGNYPKSLFPGATAPRNAPPTEELAATESTFHLQGTGSYGSILKYVDRLQTAKVLVSIDRFSISPSSVFFSLFSDVNRKPLMGSASDADTESAGRHAFLIRGRISLRPKKEDAK